MNLLFSDRFHGHEMPVDPGVWQGIQQQMAHAATASGADGVSKLFKDRFQGHETAVDPAVWQGISAQLGHTVVGTTVGSGFLGWVASGVLAVTVGTVAYFALGEPKTTTIPVVADTLIEQVTPTITPKAPVAELAPLNTRSVSQEAPTSHPAHHATHQHAQVVSEPSRPQEPIGPDPVLSSSPDATVQPTLPTKEGAAVVESIIADITTEVKQQVLEQRDGTQMPASGQPTSGQDGADHEAEVAAMPQLFVPNIFTPNGDGPNDVYEIGSEGFDQVLIRVYSVKDNRLVFSTNSNIDHWTGANCEDGMYLVAVEARTLDGRTATEGKVVWLNRNP